MNRFLVLLYTESNKICVIFLGCLPHYGNCLSVTESTQLLLGIGWDFLHNTRQFIKLLVLILLG